MGGKGLAKHRGKTSQRSGNLKCDKSLGLCHKICFQKREEGTSQMKKRSKRVSKVGDLWQDMLWVRR